MQMDRRLIKKKKKKTWERMTEWRTLHSGSWNPQGNFSFSGHQFNLYNVVLPKEAYCDYWYNCVWRFDLYLVKLHLNTVKLGMVVHVYNPSTWDPGAEELLQVQGQAKTPFQSKTNKYILILWSLWENDRLSQMRQIKEYLSLKQWFS